MPAGKLRVILLLAPVTTPVNKTKHKTTDKKKEADDIKKGNENMNRQKNLGQQRP